MNRIKLSAARREIIEAYNVVRQVPGEQSIVFRVAKMLGRAIDKEKNNSFVRLVIKDYQQMLKDNN